MKLKVLRDLPGSELEEKLKEAKIELFNLRFQLATGQLENVMKIKETRRSIARIQTVRKERELEAARKEKTKTQSKPAGASSAPKAEGRKAPINRG